MAKELFADIAIAEQYANSMQSKLAPLCEVVKIAGSVRRYEHQVHDVELVCIPNYETSVADLFGGPPDKRGCQLTKLLLHWLKQGYISERRDKNGRLIGSVKEDARYVALYSDFEITMFDEAHLPQSAALPLDIFIVRPDIEPWFGWHYLLRTGSAYFNKKMVTAQDDGGLKPAHVSMDKGKIYVDGKPHPTPTEKDVFDLWGLRYQIPAHRGEDMIREWI